MGWRRGKRQHGNRGSRAAIDRRRRGFKAYGIVKPFLPVIVVGLQIALRANAPPEFPRECVRHIVFVIGFKPGQTRLNAMRLDFQPVDSPAGSLDCSLTPL
jgi:hypothetical protein